MKKVEEALRGFPLRSLEERSKRAAGHLAGGAESKGLIDVAYAAIDSPFGPLLGAVTPRGLVRLAYRYEPSDDVLSGLAARLSPRVLEAPHHLDEVRRQLDEYFEGRRREFEFPIDWTLSQGFTRRVLQATHRLGYGQVSTYRQMASKAGNPKASRAAGNALGDNPIPIVVPCHRILRSDGSLGGYTGGIERKVFLLRLEGVDL